jgi:hypothetical protein
MTIILIIHSHIYDQLMERCHGNNTETNLKKRKNSWFISHLIFLPKFLAFKKEAPGTRTPSTS